MNILGWILIGVVVMVFYVVYLIFTDDDPTPEIQPTKKKYGVRQGPVKGAWGDNCGPRH